MGMTFHTRLRVVTTRYYTVEPLSRHPLPSSNSIATCQRQDEGRNGSSPSPAQPMCARREDARSGLQSATPPEARLHSKNLAKIGTHRQQSNGPEQTAKAAIYSRMDGCV